MLKGFKTLFMNALYGIAGEGIVNNVPMDPVAQHWLTVFIAAWALTGMVLRFWTDTPVGQKTLATLEQKFGLTDEQMQAFLNIVAPMHANAAQILNQALALIGAIKVVPAAAPPQAAPVPNATVIVAAAPTAATQPPAPATAVGVTLTGDASLTVENSKQGA